MRNIHGLLVLVLALAAPVAQADDAPSAEGQEPRSQGWKIPEGQEARFAQDERECAKQSLSPRGRRVDVRQWESCMTERGWRRK